MTITRITLGHTAYAERVEGGWRLIDKGGVIGNRVRFLDAWEAAYFEGLVFWANNMVAEMRQTKEVIQLKEEPK